MEYRFYTELKKRTGQVLEIDVLIEVADTETGFEIGDTRILLEDGKILVIRARKDVQSVRFQDILI